MLLLRQVRELKSLGLETRGECADPSVGYWLLDPDEASDNASMDLMQFHRLLFTRK